MQTSIIVLVLAMRIVGVLMAFGALGGAVPQCDTINVTSGGDEPGALDARGAEGAVKLELGITTSGPGTFCLPSSS